MKTKSARPSAPASASLSRYRVPIIAACAVIVVAGLAYLYWSQKKAQEYEEAYKKGMASWKSRQFEPALTQLRKAAHADPRDPELWVAIGRVELTLDHADRAREAWEEALRREPEYKPALFERGKEAYCRHLLGCLPPTVDKASGWLPLGLDFAAQKGDDPKRLLADLRAGSAHSTEFLRFAKGAMELLEGKYHDARPSLQAYADENGWDASAIALVGIAGLYGATPDRAEKSLTEALAQRNEKAWRVLRGHARFLQCNDEGARSDYSGAEAEKEAEPLFAKRFPAQGLILWLKSDAGVEVNGTSVTRWSDQSERHQDASPLKPENAPQLAAAAFRGKPAIVFAGGEDELRLPDGFEDFHSGLSAFIVGEPQTEAGEPWSFLFLATASRGAVVVETLLGRRRESDQIVYASEDVNSGRNPFVAGIAPAKGFDVFSVVHEPTETARLYKRGQPAGSGTLLLPRKVLRTRNRIGVGLKGQVAEILLYNRSLSELERLGVEAYLKVRYFPDAAAAPAEKR